MICAEDVVVGLDGTNLIPIQIGSTLVSTPRFQSSAVIDLGKKLLHSAREGDTETVLELMGKGAPFSSDWLGTTPLHLAAMNDHVDTCDILLRAGISRETRTKVERTPLHLAAYEGHDRVCRLLLDYEAEVDCRDMLQMTPLHWAVEKGHTKCVDALLEYNADPNLVSKFHKTPLSIAAEIDRQDLVEKLQQSALNKQKCRSISQNNDSRDMDEVIAGKEKCNDLTDASENDVHASFAELLPKVSSSANEATLQLLRDHGITMLPADTSNTVTSAIQSGRTIVLSDAGKLMLKETSPKQIHIKKNPLLVQPNKLRNTKVYALSSSQFMALTGQNKSAVHRLPANTFKKSPAPGINFIQFSKAGQVIDLTQPKPKISKIAPVKAISNGNSVAVNVATLNQGELTSLHQFPARQRQVIQLKNNRLPPGVKIVMNKNNVGKIVIPQSAKLDLGDIAAKVPTSNASRIPQVEHKLNYEDLVTDDLSYNNKSTEELKRLLRSAKAEVRDYKIKLEATEKELEICRERLKLHEGQSVG